MSWQYPAEFSNGLAKKKFLSGHIFHERQMNSCPIGCDGCAVEAKTTAKGSVNFQDLYGFYKDAYDLGVSLKITKVEGYDPVFLSYNDEPDTPFAESIKAAIDLGHTIITPLCTTGTWKSEKTIWQLTEIGKLDEKYRQYTYPSGIKGDSFVLSVPREIRPYSAGKYDFNQHIAKLLFDIELLTVGGNLEVLIYHNSKIANDLEFANKIKDSIKAKLTPDQASKTQLKISDFNGDITPESCMRYENSVLISSEGFSFIDPVILDWNVKEVSNLAPA